MADQTITPADVSQVSPTPSLVWYVAGEAIDAGEAFYSDATDTVNGKGKAKLARCNGTAEEADVEGFALNSAAAGQPVAGHSTTAGAPSANKLLNVTSAAVGQSYVLSTTPGKVMLESDLATGNYVTYLATGATATRYSVAITATGIQHA